MSTAVPLIELLDALVLKGQQTLENNLLEFVTINDIDSSAGSRLDLIGGRVGLPRNNLPDEIYRIFIKAWIVINSSSGRSQDIIAALEILSSDPYCYLQIYSMALDLFADVPLEYAAQIKQFMEQAALAGVSILTIQPSSALNCFGFLGSENSETFGDSTDSDVGGNFSYIIV